MEFAESSFLIKFVKYNTFDLSLHLIFSGLLKNIQSLIYPPNHDILLYDFYGGWIEYRTLTFVPSGIRSCISHI